MPFDGQPILLTAARRVQRVGSERGHLLLTDTALRFVPERAEPSEFRASSVLLRPGRFSYSLAGIVAFERRMHFVFGVLPVGRRLLAIELIDGSKHLFVVALAGRWEIEVGRALEAAGRAERASPRPNGL